MNNVINYRIVGERTDVPYVQIYGAEDVARYCRAYLYNGGDIYVFEKCYLLLINQANKIVGTAQIGQGAITQCCIDVRLICRYAIEHLSCSCIIVHNHPSGNCCPSYQDKELSNKVRQALAAVDVLLLDFLILTDDGHLSFSDEGFI